MPEPKKKKRPNPRQRQRRRNRNNQDTLSTKELAEEYGFGWKFFKHNDELWKLLKDATEGPDAPWGPQRFITEFRATKWYKTHSEIYRQNKALQYTDPATWRERRANHKAMVDNLASQWGADLDHKQLQRIANRSFMLGWDEAQTLDFLAKRVRPDDHGHYGGELSGIEQHLRDLSYQNGVSIPRVRLRTMMRQIVRGEADVREYETWIRDVAAKTYSAYAKEIKSGVNVLDLASPYIQAMANVLEMNPGAIGLDDRTLRRAMTHRTDKGEAQPMSLSDFEDSLRADRRWQYTDNAKEQMKAYANALGKMWGVI